MSAEVTVVMPVHNAMPWLDSTIRSIVAQTYTEFKLAIYDDGSTDGSLAVAREWASRDPRISVQVGGTRLGTAGAGNAAAALAKTELVARMDADDLMIPERLAIQVDVFRRFPDTIMVGGAALVIDGQDKLLYRHSVRPSSKNAPFMHPTMMYRRSAFEAIGGYRTGCDYYEDLDLLARLCNQGPTLMTNRELIRYRADCQHHILTDEYQRVFEKLSEAADSISGKRRSGSRFAAMAFYPLAVKSVLGGRRPNLLKVMVKRARLPTGAIEGAAIGFVALAELSPKTAAKAWRAVQAVRVIVRPRTKVTDDVFLWTPH